MSEHELEPEIVTVAEAATAVIHDVIPMAEMIAFFDRAFTTVATVVASEQVGIAGPPFARYFGPVSDTVDLEVGFPVGGPVEGRDGVLPGSLPGGEVAHVVHVGSYDGLGESWGKLYAWVAGRGRVPGSAGWEVYVTEPTPDMDPADLRTELFLPIAP